MITTSDDIANMVERWRQEREENIATQRATLIHKLRALSVTSLTIQYDGYGDSGNVEDLTAEPNDITLPDDLDLDIREFGWLLAYHQHPGFEINEGGYGTLEWDIAADTINLDHADRVIETNHSYHEGI